MKYGYIVIFIIIVIILVAFSGCTSSSFTPTSPKSTSTTADDKPGCFTHQPKYSVGDIVCGMNCPNYGIVITETGTMTCRLPGETGPCPSYTSRMVELQNGKWVYSYPEQYTQYTTVGMACMVDNGHPNLLVHKNLNEISNKIPETYPKLT